MTLSLDDLRALIASGERLTVEQDDAAYALLPSEEYYALTDDQKPPKATSKEPIATLSYAKGAWCVFIVSGAIVSHCPAAQVADAPGFPFRRGETMQIDIMAFCRDEREAIILVEEFTASGQYHKPDGSVAQGNKVICLTDGKTYASVRQAANAYGISHTSIYNHWKGVSPAPRGLEFAKL